MYFRSRGVITGDQLILGLGIQPQERPGDNANFEGAATEDLADARGDQFLPQKLERSGASSPAEKVRKTSVNVPTICVAKIAANVLKLAR
jgi:hypothetical protein